VVDWPRNDSLFAWMLLGSGLLLLSVPFVTPEPARLLLFALVAAYYLTQCVLIEPLLDLCRRLLRHADQQAAGPGIRARVECGRPDRRRTRCAHRRLAEPLATIAVWGALLLCSAAMLRLARRPLRRWGPLGGEEADETSVEGLAAAIRFVPGSRLGRWLLLTSLGMVIAQFVAQYIYSDVFVRSFPDPTTLAVFISPTSRSPTSSRSRWAMGHAVADPALRRGGRERRASRAHARQLRGIVRRSRSTPRSAARANRELIENALAQPARTLVFNALPPRFRGRIRALLEGVVVYGGMTRRARSCSRSRRPICARSRARRRAALAISPPTSARGAPISTR
jgi:hypothetical protein